MNHFLVNGQFCFDVKIVFTSASFLYCLALFCFFVENFFLQSSDDDDVLNLYSAHFCWQLFGQRAITGQRQVSGM